MATFNALYVRAADKKKAAALNAEYPLAFSNPGSEYYVIELEDTDYEPAEDDLASLSARLNTDVLSLSFQSAADAFQFHHWRSGEQVRALVFRCFEQERTWERADGEPEPWELEVFFDPEELSHAIEDANSEEAEELRRIWREAEIIPGQVYPSIDARQSAHKIVEFYRFPVGS